jgi:hypothetical protein
VAGSFSNAFSAAFGSALNVATVALKVNAGAGYEDGDILCVFNRRRIRCAHAEHVCDFRTAPRSTNGLIIVGSLSQAWFETTHQYRFERVSATEVRRVDLITATEEVFGLTPNGQGEAIDVVQFIARRKQQPLHYLFGDEGAEIWYGGAVDTSNAKLDVVWNAIETNSPLREADYPDMPLAGQQLRSHLFVRMSDMSDADAEALIASEVDTSDPENPVVVRKRKRMIAWRSLPDMAAHVSNVENPSVAVDLRPVVRKYPRGLYEQVKA